MVPVPAASPEKAKQRAFAPASKSDSQPNGLNEVVVVGYGVQKRQNATGSVSTVRIRGTATTPGADSIRAEDALAGRVAGLNADKNNVLEEAYRAPSPLTGETAFENYLRTKTVNPGQYNGTVRVSFTVMPDGTLQGFKVIRHLNEACDAEAIRVIREGPAWIPASDGKPAKVKVRVKFTVKKD
jgi:TonB family protein